MSDDTPTPEKDGPKSKPSALTNLAQRSAGLPTEAGPKEEKAEPSPWQHVGLGFQIAGTTLVMGLIGWEMDRLWATGPWCMFGLGMAGAVGSIYLLIKEALRLGK